MPPPEMLETYTKDSPSFTDYARDIDDLIRVEGDRIRRILEIIDESMAAIHKTRLILKKF
jgi:hypothetical protein